MTANNEVLQRLDRIIAILQIAHKDPLDRAREEVAADKVDAAILSLAAKETPAGKLVKAVEAKDQANRSLSPQTHRPPHRARTARKVRRQPRHHVQSDRSDLATCQRPIPHYARSFSQKLG